MGLKKFYMNYEFRRKSVHFFMGTSFAFIITIDYFYRYAKLFILGMFIISIIASVICKYLKPKLVLAMLQLFDKPKDFERLPGKGAIYYLAGMLVSLLLFERDVVSASVIILAVGDPTAHFFGRYFGRTRLIINEKKLLEGTLAGTLFATVAALFFVPFHLAFFGSALGMIAEAIELEYFNLDDNFSIPFVAGTVMSLIKAAL